MATTCRKTRGGDADSVITSKDVPLASADLWLSSLSTGGWRQVDSCFVRILTLLFDCSLDQYIADCKVFPNYLDADNDADSLLVFMRRVLHVGGRKISSSINVDQSSFDRLVMHCRLLLQLHTANKRLSSHHSRCVGLVRHLRNDLSCSSQLSSGKCTVVAGQTGNDCLPPSIGAGTGQDRTDAEGGGGGRADHIWISTTLAVAEWLMCQEADVVETSSLRQQVRPTASSELMGSAAKLMAALILYGERKRLDDLLSGSLSSSADVECRRAELVILRAVLDNHYSCCSDVIVVNRPMLLGNRPLCLAARAKRSNVIATLLRHGADVTARCELGMRCDAIEALFFAPYESAADQRSGRLNSEAERCIRLVMAVTDHLPIGRLKSLETAGYQPKYTDWRRVLVEQTCRAWSTTPSCSPLSVIPAPLRQLARCTVRSLVIRSASSATPSCHGCVEGVAKRIELLEIPTTLKRCLLLTDC